MNNTYFGQCRKTFHPFNFRHLNLFVHIVLFSLTAPHKWNCHISKYNQVSKITIQAWNVSMMLPRSIPPIDNRSSKTATLKNRSNKLVSWKKTINCYPYTLQLIRFWKVSFYLVFLKHTLKIDRFFFGGIMLPSRLNVKHKSPTWEVSRRRL